MAERAEQAEKSKAEESKEKAEDNEPVDAVLPESIWRLVGIGGYFGLRESKLDEWGLAEVVLPTTLGPPVGKPYIKESARSSDEASQVAPSDSEKVVYPETVGELKEWLNLFPNDAPLYMDVGSKVASIQISMGFAARRAE